MISGSTSHQPGVLKQPSVESVGRVHLTVYHFHRLILIKTSLREMTSDTSYVIAEGSISRNLYQRRALLCLPVYAYDRVLHTFSQDAH